MNNNQHHLVMAPVCDEYGQGLEIDFDATPLESIIHCTFIEPGILQDSIHQMFTSLGMDAAEAWKYAPNLFNHTRDYILSQLVAHYTNAELVEMRVLTNV